MHKLSTWKLAALDQQRAALEEAQKATIEAIDRDAIDERHSGRERDASSARHRQQIEVVKAQHVTQSKLALEQGARTKLAERLVDSVDAKYRMQQERSDLGDLIERSLGKDSASSA